MRQVLASAPAAAALCGAVAPAQRPRPAAAPLAARRTLGGARLALAHPAAAPCAKRSRAALAVRAAFVDGIADARIKVIGCGGGGGNAVNRMIMAGLQVGTPGHVQRTAALQRAAAACAAWPGR
jgi:hypothetical protein